jgi:hypothetical protein
VMFDATAMRPPFACEIDDPGYVETTMRSGADGVGQAARAGRIQVRHVHHRPASAARREHSAPRLRKCRSVLPLLIGFGSDAPTTAPERR